MYKRFDREKKLSYYSYQYIRNRNGFVRYLSGYLYRSATEVKRLYTEE
jgi:hypothetical protein